MRKRLGGSLNSAGFSSCIQNGYLPQQSHLTYEGVFNDSKFSIGPISKEPLELHYEYGRYQYEHSLTNKGIKEYMAIFLKSNRDGQQRDDRILNATVLLDISGSMKHLLRKNKDYAKIEHQANSNRLQLSLQAICMLVSKLRKDDSFGLVVFNTEAKIIQPQTKISQLDLQLLLSRIKNITADGGTTISSGFKCGKQMMQEYLGKNSGFGENRIILVTDVLDNSIETQSQFVRQAAESNINMTVIGVSDCFRSSTCQKLKNIKGFNYFCAVTEEDLKKYVFETFQFTFFPCATDLQLRIQADGLKSFCVYGSPDSNSLNEYNNWALSTDFENGIYNEQLIISKMKTVFPSEVEIHASTTLSIGGLILLKLNRAHRVEGQFKGKLICSYKQIDLSSEQFEVAFCIHYPLNEQFYTSDSMMIALDGFIFVEECRTVLREYKQSKGKLGKDKLQAILQSLSHLKVPFHRQKEIDAMIGIISK